MVMRRTICGLVGALSAFSGASAYGKMILTPLHENVEVKAAKQPSRRFHCRRLPFIACSGAILSD